MPDPNVNHRSKGRTLSAFVIKLHHVSHGWMNCWKLNKQQFAQMDKKHNCDPQMDEWHKIHHEQKCSYNKATQNSRFSDITEGVTKRLLL